MNTWSCDTGPARGRSMLLRALAGLTGAAMLAGCLDGTGANRRPGAPETVAVARGAVVVGGPKGYCIDEASSRAGADAGFVLLAGCASISGNPRDPMPDPPALLTASVAGASDAAPAGAEELDRLAEFLTTPEGRATLARDGQAGSVEILDQARVPGALLLHLQDSGIDPAFGLSTDYWRGIFELNGRLITVSVKGFASGPLSAEQGRVAMHGFIARIRAESAPAAANPGPVAAPAPRKTRFSALFR